MEEENKFKNELEEAEAEAEAKSDEWGLFKIWSIIIALFAVMIIPRMYSEEIMELLDINLKKIGVGIYGKGILALGVFVWAFYTLLSSKTED